jgi:fatty acid amide hydrolase
MSAGELAGAIAAGTVTSREAVEAHIQRIRAVNPDLNALIFPRFDEARAEAAEADARHGRGEPLGPLHGVPITVKDSFDVAGLPTVVGLPSRTGHRAGADSPLVARLRAAGAIILGKTNVPQMLLYNETDNPVFGLTRNPWDQGRAPGGSSGGEGATIAAGGSPLGIGSDIGGSIREPAHACGIHGLKPTTGRLSLAGEADSWLFAGQEAILAQPGPLARTVADLALAMEILTAPGQERFDPAIPPVPWRDPAEVRLSGLRVGFYTDDGFFPAAPALRRAVREAAEALRLEGAAVEPFTPPDVAEAMRIYFGVLGADGGRNLLPLLAGGQVDRRLGSLVQVASMPKPFRITLAALLAAFGQRRMAETVRAVGQVSTGAYWNLTAARARYKERFLAALDEGGFDVIICPPHALPALTHGASYSLSSAASYAMLYNLLGMPAGVVSLTRVRPGEESDRPASRDGYERAARQVEEGSAGLPVGVQVVARHWREDAVLAVMAALEARFRTRTDYPQLSTR